MADDEVVAGFGCDFFYAGENRANELAFEFMDNDPDGVGLLHPEVAGKAVGAVPHFFGGVHDPFARLDIDGGMIFESPADCGGREAEYPGQIINRDILFSRHK